MKKNSNVKVQLDGLLDGLPGVSSDGALASALLTPGAARAVRLHVRRGARVLGFSSAAALESKLWRTRSSFAVATRGVPPEQTSLNQAARRQHRHTLQPTH